MVFINVIAQEFWDDEDADSDSYTNGEEVSYGTDPYDPNSYPGNVSGGDMTGSYEDPYLVDTDGDTIPDYEETSGREVWYDYYDEASGTYFPISEWITTDPDDADTDNDGIDDGVEWDLYNLGWSQPPHWFRPTDNSDGLADWDSDGLSNALEIGQLGTNLLNADSDDDGVFTDFDEWLMGTNPLDPLDPAPETETEPEGDPDTGTGGGGNESGENLPDPGSGENPPNSDPPPSSQGPDGSNLPSPESPGPDETSSGDQSDTELVGRKFTLRPGVANLVPGLEYDPEWESQMWGYTDDDWHAWESANPTYVSTVDGGPHPVDRRYDDLSLTTRFEADYSHPEDSSQDPRVIEGKEAVVDRMLDPTGLWNGTPRPWSGTLPTFTGPRPINSDLKITGANIDAIGRIYPEGKHAEVWLRRETATPYPISRTYLIAATRKNFDDPVSGTPDFGGPPNTVEYFGTATFTIAANEKVSSVCEIQLGPGFPANWISNSGGGLKLKPTHNAPHLDPSNFLQGGEDNKVSLLPVEIVGPKLKTDEYESAHPAVSAEYPDQFVPLIRPKIAQWEEAFQENSNIKSNFLEIDNDRFYIQTPFISDELCVYLAVKSENDAIIDDFDNLPLIIQGEAQRTNSQILVTSEFDDGYNWVTGEEDNSKADGFGDRTHRIESLSDKVVIEIRKGVSAYRLGNQLLAELEFPVSSSESEMLNVTPIVLGQNDGISWISTSEVIADIDRARRPFLQVDINIAATTAPQIVPTDPFSDECQFQVIVGSVSCDYFLSEYGTPQSTSDVRILYVYGLKRMKFSPNLEVSYEPVFGCAFSDSHPVEFHRNNIFTTSPIFEGGSTDLPGIHQDCLLVTAHEIGHLLTNGDHYDEGKNFNQNLMRSFASTFVKAKKNPFGPGLHFDGFYKSDGKISSKGCWRIYEEQETIIRSSRLLVD